MSKKSLEINFFKPSTKKDKIIQRKHELLNHLRKQYKFLCKSIIDDDIDEIDRIALCIRILFHESSNSKSLLKQISPSIEILDTSPNTSFEIEKESTDKISNFWYGGLVKLTSSNFYELAPSKTPNYVPIDDWWERVLFVDNNNSFSRQNIVLTIADKDGGAHVDNKLPLDYYNLSRFGSNGMSFFLEGKKVIPQGPEKIILPHIGREVAWSLRKVFPKICPDRGIEDPSQKF